MRAKGFLQVAAFFRALPSASSGLSSNSLLSAPRFKAVVAAFWAFALLAGCSENLSGIAGAHGDLLAGKRAARKTGISQTERLTDALIAIDGDNWRSDLTTPFKATGEVVWDLGQPEQIGCAFLQGDNNDTYYIDGSEDGSTWTPLWSALPLKTPGMQSRTTTSLNARARYLRLHATGGDGLFSASEVAVYSHCDPAAFPPHFEQRTGVPESDSSAVPWRFAILVVSVLLVMFRPRSGQERQPGPPGMLIPVGIITMLSGVLMDTMEMALLGMAVLAWPLVKSLFESSDPKGSKTEPPSKEQKKPS